VIARVQRGLVAGLAIAGVVGLAAPADAAVQAGTLYCRIGTGIGIVVFEQERLVCTFHPSGAGQKENYHGDVRKFGLTLGVTGGTVVVWTVVSAQDYVPGSLAGEYVGVTAEATAMFGVGANALLGGSGKQVALQPLSVQGQDGLDVAAGVELLTLVPR
jgi:hypothetical protein